MVSMYTKKSSKGFTLIELLVVIAIIGTLASVILASLSTARTKARDANRMAQIHSIQNALQLYFTATGKFPVSGWTCSNSSGWQTGTLGTDLKPYLSSMPVDPVNQPGASYNGAQTYCYYADNYGGSGDWYMLVFTLENKNLAYEQTHAVTTCDNHVFQYGGGAGYTMTVGSNCTH